jgi:type IV secretion system protein VirB10
VVSEHVFDSKSGKYLLVPQGTKLVGEYLSTTSHGQNRAQVIWKRMILPNQKTVNIDQMPGIDRSGSAGVKGDVDNHYEDLFVGLLATSLLSSGLAATQGNSNPHQLSPQAQIGGAVAQDVMRFGSKVADRNLDIKPTITVESGSKISVFATRNLVLEPYSYE